MIIHHRRLLRFPVRGLIGALSHSAFLSTGQRRDPCSRRTTMRTRANCQISPAPRVRINARGRAAGPEKVRASSGATTQASRRHGDRGRGPHLHHRAAGPGGNLNRPNGGVIGRHVGFQFAWFLGAERLARTHHRDGPISSAVLNLEDTLQAGVCTIFDKLRHRLARPLESPSRESRRAHAAWMRVRLLGPGLRRGGRRSAAAGPQAGPCSHCWRSEPLPHDHATEPPVEESGHPAADRLWPRR